MLFSIVISESNANCELIIEQADLWHVFSSVPINMKIILKVFLTLRA